MTLPPNLYIKDKEFDKLHDELSYLGQAVYFPLAVTTGGIFGSLVGITIGGLLHFAGMFIDLDSAIVFAILICFCSALMFVQRYALHGSQSITHIGLAQALTFIIFFAIFPKSLKFNIESLQFLSHFLKELGKQNPIVVVLGWVGMVGGLSLWLVTWVRVCEIKPLVSIQKSILRAIQRLPIFCRA